MTDLSRGRIDWNVMILNFAGSCCEQGAEFQDVMVYHTGIVLDKVAGSIAHLLVDRCVIED